MQAANIEAEGSGIPDCEYQLTKHEVSCLGHGKYSGTHDILSLAYALRQYNFFYLVKLYF